MPKRSKKKKKNKKNKHEDDMDNFAVKGLCVHKPAVKVFPGNELFNFPVWAGAAQSQCLPPANTLICDLANAYQSSIFSNTLTVPKELAMKRITFDWTDGSGFDWDVTSWKFFMAWIRHEIVQHELEGIYIACAGGHGRTGTFLTIWGVLAGYLVSSDPLAELRKKYCDKAVETIQQINYLQTLKIRTKEKAAGFGYNGASVMNQCYATLHTDKSYQKCIHTCYRGSHADDWHWCTKCKLDWQYIFDLDKLLEKSVQANSPIAQTFKLEYPGYNAVRVTPDCEGIYFEEPLKEAMEGPTIITNTKTGAYCTATQFSPTQKCQHVCGFFANHESTSHYCTDCKDSWFQPTPMILVGDEYE